MEIDMRSGVLFVGHSHINCIKAASAGARTSTVDAGFMQLRDPQYGKDPAARLAPPRFEDCDLSAVSKDISGASGSVALSVLCPTGNEHNVVSLVNRPLVLKQDLLRDRLTGLFANYRNWLGFLARHVGSPVVVIPPPPPVESSEFILKNPGPFSEALQQSGASPSRVRLQMYLHQLRLIRECAAESGLEFVELPGEVINERGFLHERFLGNDPTHANAAYGELILHHVSVSAAQAKPAQAGQGRPTDNAHNKKIKGAGPLSSAGNEPGSTVESDMAMKIAVIGHSHIKCMVLASREINPKTDIDFVFVQLHKYKVGRMPGAQNLSIHNIDKSNVSRAVTRATQGASVAVLSITGNAPVIFGLQGPGKSGGTDQPVVSEQTKNEIASYVTAYNEWLLLLKQLVRVPLLVLPPPPPVGSNDWIHSNMGPFKEALERFGVSTPEYRLEIYRLWSDGIRDAVSKNGMQLVELPNDVFNDSGFLAECYFDEEPAHANAAYGTRLLKHLSEICEHQIPASMGANLTATDRPHEMVDVRDHPYLGLPDWSFWKQGVAQVPLQAFDPVVEVPFRITRTDKVATAGSCFAQHISKRLRSGGFQFLHTEQSTDGGESCEACGGYDFSARYGNIYTARQLVQLFDRAYGYFNPIDTHWSLPAHRFCDPFRPRIEADGYPSIDALVENRQRHLAAVREMFEQLDIFVFTLGLTECWISRLDGAAYPLAPGVAGGEFDPVRYQFVNFGVDEVVRDMESFIQKLRLVNPGAKLILTVSPVPLAATYAASHVLASTTYSKSVLRVAAEMVTRSCEGVYYFPSFEIITGNYNRGRYFGPDLRTVTEEGVDHVMSVFMRHLTDTDTARPATPTACAAVESDTELAEMMALAEAACDEELLARE